MEIRDREANTYLSWVLIVSDLFKTQSQGRIMVGPFLIATSVN